MRAPCTALIPIGPRPNTATSDPASIGKRHIASPSPVPPTQASTDDSIGGTFVKSGTTHSSSETMISEYPAGPMGGAVMYAGVLSDIVAEGIAGSRVLHRSPRPARQFAHTPQFGVVASITWSPTFTRLTSRPTSSTTPTPPCPATTATAARLG